MVLNISCGKETNFTGNIVLAKMKYIKKKYTAQSKM